MNTTCYRYFDSEGRLLYIGVTKSLLDRQEHHQKNQPWWAEVATATFTHFATRQDALDYETKMIGIEFPKYNKAGAVLPQDSQEHLAAIITSQFDDEFHSKASQNMTEWMLEMNDFSEAPESYKLLFAFDRSMPWDEEGEERLVDCLNCQRILDSNWYKQLCESVDALICDESIALEGR